MKTRDEVIVELATELSRCRALSDRESRWLERSLRDHDRRNKTTGYWATKDRWLPREDAQVQRQAAQGITAHDIAKSLGRTPASVRSRVRFLRRRGKIEAMVEVERGG